MFWKAITVATLLVLAATEANGQNFDLDRIRNLDMEVGEQLNFHGVDFDINRIGRGKLGSRVISGSNSFNESMIIAKDDKGNFAGSVRMDGKNFRVMPDGKLRRAGRITQNDVVIRKSFMSDDRPVAFDNPKNSIVDRWHNPGWQNLMLRADGNRVGLWYTPESDRSITYVDVFAYFDQNIGGNPKLFLDAEIAKANEIFQRSNVYIRLNLVGYEVVDVAVENAQTTLGKLDAGTTPFNSVSAKRNETGADLVHAFLSTDTRRKMCGVAYLGGYKGRWDYRDNVGVTICHGGESFVHELAHNFGSDHDEANAGSGFHFWYSLGYNRRNQQGFDEVSTVMSYGNAEVGVFSNPDIQCKGQPCGLEDVSDNSRSLNETRKWVALANGPTDGSSSGTYLPPDTTDSDSDGVTDTYDTCPNTPYGAEVDAFGCEIDDNTGGGTDSGGTDTGGGTTNTDNDGDDVSNYVDNCPNTYNPNQYDNDGDGQGNACDNTPNGNSTPPSGTVNASLDISSHGGICERSRSTNRDYVVNFRGFQNKSNSGSIWAVCPLSRGTGTSMIAAEITVLPVTDSAGNYNIQCDLVEIYEGSVEETISLSVSPNQTNTGESTHVFDPVTVSDVNNSSFAIECQVPRGHAITGIRQVSGN